MTETFLSNDSKDFTHWLPVCTKIPKSDMFYSLIKLQWCCKAIIPGAGHLSSFFVPIPEHLAAFRQLIWGGVEWRCWNWLMHNKADLLCVNLSLERTKGLWIVCVGYIWRGGEDLYHQVVKW